MPPDQTPLTVPPVVPTPPPPAPPTTPPAAPIEAVLPSATPSSQSPQSRSFLYASLVILALVAMGGGFFWWNKLHSITTQLPLEEQTAVDPMADWKTYVNAKYGYEFKYPPTIAIESFDAKSSAPANGMDDDVSVGALMSITPSNPLGRCSDNRTEATITSCLKTISGVKVESDKWIPVEIGGQPAVVRRQIISDPSQPYGSQVSPVGGIYYVNSDNAGFQIAFGDSPSQIPLSEEILSTFKFTDHATTTSAWQTYSNKQYGFELKYPSGTELHDVDISGGREFQFATLADGSAYVQVVTQAWYGGKLRAPANCNDFEAGVATSTVRINGIDFTKGDVSKDLSGMHSPTSATEYCTVAGDGRAYKLISRQNGQMILSTFHFLSN